jgi:integrase
VRSPEGANATPTVFPFESWSEVLTVANEAREYDPLVRFACATGLRPEEWAALEARDIDNTNRTASILRTYSFTERTVQDAGKTPGALRTVTLSRPALTALKDVAIPLRGPIFTAPEGGYVHLTNFRRRVWNPALIAAGVHHRPLYQMRHTFATLALAQGCTLEWIAGQMGHTDIRTTVKYYARFVRQVDERMRALLDQMEDQDEASQDHALPRSN